MVAPYRLYGAELSPYSVKVRQVLKYKNIPHEWVPRTLARQAEFQRFAKLPLVPVLVGSDDFSQQDSTPIIETLERRYPEPSIKPPEPGLIYLSALLEDYADEWLNKAMFHYRWSHEDDQKSAAGRIVEGMLGGAPADDREGMEAAILDRMVQRRHLVGSSAQTAPVIERSFRRLVGLLEVHLMGRNYLFGGRPAVADFGLGAQLGQLLSDPTPGRYIRESAPTVAAWIARLENASPDGDWETFAALSPTLAPLLRDEVARTYLPWMAANAAAVGAGESLETTLPDGPFAQTPQKYAARSWGEIQNRYRDASQEEALADLMVQTGCAEWLAADQAEDSGGEDDESEEGGED